MPQPPIVVFDIGNVLLRWDRRFLYRKMFSDEAAMEDFLATALSIDWVLERDADSIGPGVAARIAQYPQFSREIAAFDTRWIETIGGVIDENVALFRRLKDAGRPVYGITNFPADKFELARTIFPFFDWFDGIVVSGQEGLLKPDPKIFELFFRRYGLAPADTLFVDDSARNVATAAAIGMQTIHFVDGVDLDVEFSQKGMWR